VDGVDGEGALLPLCFAETEAPDSATATAAPLVIMANLFFT
jgi:hypothetical protein